MMNNFIDNEDVFTGSLTDSERNEILDEVSDDVLISIIKDQISNEDDSYNNIDHISSLEKRYNNIVTYYSSDPELLLMLVDRRDKFYKEIEKALTEKLSITIDEELNDRYLVIKALYNHFILNINDTYLNFFMKFIENNKKTLINLKEQGKSIDAFALKKKIKNKDLITLLSNLYPIIDYIIDLELQSSFVFKSTFEEGEVNSFILNNNISKIILGDDFVYNFLGRLKEERNNYFKIALSLQTMLYEKYVNEESL